MEFIYQGTIKKDLIKMLQKAGIQTPLQLILHALMGLVCLGGLGVFIAMFS